MGMCVCVRVCGVGRLWGYVESKTGSNLPRISKCIQESMGRGKER